MVIDFSIAASGFNIPELNVAISRSGGQNIGSGGVEVENTATLLMSRQSDQGFSDSACEATLGNLPDLDIAIFRGRGDDVVIEGVEVNVLNVTSMATEDGEFSGKLANSRVGDNSEVATTSRLPLNSEESRIGLDEVRVESAVSDTNVVVALLFLVFSTEDVAEFGSTDATHVFSISIYLKQTIKRFL